MPKLTMLKQPVRKDQEHEEDRGEKKAPVLLAGRSKGFLGRLGSAGRGYALAGAGVVAAAVVAVSLLSWLAPDSDRPIASPLEAVGRVASGVVEQVDDQVEALLGTYEEKPILRSVREGIATASSATPWPSGKSIEVAASPSTGPASSSSSAAPTRGGGSSLASEGAPSQRASSTPSPSSAGTSEAPTTTTEAPSSSPTAADPSVPPPSTEEPPPTVEEPSPPPPTQEEPP